MYRISVTTIEKFRRFMTEASSFDQEEDLIKSIKGEFEGNNKTWIGGAYHGVIEGKYRIHINKGQYFIADDIAFSAEQAKPALDYKRAHPKMIHEVSFTKPFTLKDQTIMVSCRTDGMEGREVGDVKCKFGQVDFTEFLDSYQWRFYLSMFGMDAFHYDLFHFQGFDDNTILRPGVLNYLPGVDITYQEPLYCYRYDNLEADVRQLLQEFMEYIHFRDLYQYLKTVPDVKQAI